MLRIIFCVVWTTCVALTKARRRAKRRAAAVQRAVCVVPKAIRAILARVSMDFALPIAKLELPGVLVR